MPNQETYDFPVFGTQGGGLVREVSKNPHRYVFVEVPDCPGLDVDDFMPEEWGVMPANMQAQRQIEKERMILPIDEEDFELDMGTEAGERP